MGNGYLCLSDVLVPELTNPSDCINIYDTGFFSVDHLSPGKYVYITKDLDEVVFSLHQVRVYQMPNLVGDASVITTYTALNAN